jgi:hypothetical protein
MDSSGLDRLGEARLLSEECVDERLNMTESDEEDDKDGRNASAEADDIDDEGNTGGVMERVNTRARSAEKERTLMTLGEVAVFSLVF